MAEPTFEALYAALEAGKIHGALLSAPFTLQARKAGFRLLADLRSETSCARARAKLKTRFEALGRRTGSTPVTRGPVPGVVRSTLGEETITVTYELIR